MAIADVSDKPIGELISLSGRRVRVSQKITADRGDEIHIVDSPLGRSGVPDDIARVVLFWASDLAMYMTGSTLLVDAGELL